MKFPAFSAKYIKKNSDRAPAVHCKLALDNKMRTDAVKGEE